MNNASTFFVIGSGPAGVSCAAALLNAGLSVRMLDAGIDLEPDRHARIQELAQLNLDEWSEESLRPLKANMAATPSGIPLKYVYGSDFPYRDPENDQPILSNGVGLLPSMAKGGLSNVWGGAVLPYRENDIRDWPISISELAPYYKAALELMPVSARSDDLAEWFDMYAEGPQELGASEQARLFLEDLSSARSELAARHIYFGTSRLALQSEAGSDGQGCRYCGQCMYGCPYRSIYNSAETLRSMRANPRFTYVPGVLVQNLAEKGGAVRIEALNLKTRTEEAFTANRVFIACGVLPSTKLIATALGVFDTPIMLRDSQYFLLPLLRYRSVPNVDKARLHTLAQVFLEILDPKLCESTIHLQVYTYNDLFYSAIRSVAGPLTPLLRGVVRSMLGRLLLIQGYLPSSLSPSISATLSRTNEGSVLRLDAVPNPATRPALRKVIRKLGQSRGLLRALTLPGTIRPGSPGRGFHVGGSFPMRATPGHMESDRLGRPYGLKLIHLVDASTFPSVPATTITLTVMANAMRIASEVAQA